MTITEASAILDELFVAFPHLEDYVRKVANPQATIDEWKKMIATIRHDFASQAVAKMKSGQLEVPATPWDIALLPNKLRSYAGRIADDAARDAREAKVRFESQERQRPRSGANIGRLCRASLDAGAMLRDGVISEDRNREIVGELLGQIGRSDFVCPADVEQWRQN
jgi:hypothetical protein